MNCNKYATPVEDTVHVWRGAYQSSLHLLNFAVNLNYLDKLQPISIDVERLRERALLVSSGQQQAWWAVCFENWEEEQRLQLKERLQVPRLCQTHISALGQSPSKLCAFVSFLPQENQLSEVSRAYFPSFAPGETSEDLLVDHWTPLPSFISPGDNGLEGAV